MFLFILELFKIYSFLIPKIKEFLITIEINYIFPYTEHNYHCYYLILNLIHYLEAFNEPKNNLLITIRNNWKIQNNITSFFCCL